MIRRSVKAILSQLYRLIWSSDIVINHNNHTITITGKWRTVCCFDNLPMFLVSREPMLSPTQWRYCSVVDDRGKKLTYSVLLTTRFWGHSVKVELFDGGSLMQWHDEIGQLIYSS